MKRYLFSFSLLINVLSINAQTYQNDQLIDGKWMCSESEVDTIYREFSSIYMKYNRIISEEPLGVSSVKYYLSPTIPTKFDFTKVGTKSSGKYIVTYNEELKDFSYVEIKALSKDSLVLYYAWEPADESLRDKICYQKYKRVK